MPYYTAIVTLLAVAFYFFMATRVAVARGRFGVKHPSTSGNLDFERIFRAHVNTLEWMPTRLSGCRRFWCRYGSAHFISTMPSPQRLG
jgi:glutathione S-transferase